MDIPVPEPTRPASSLNMILALGSIALLSGILVVAVFQTTLPMINENKRIAIEHAVFQVLPGTHSRRDYVVSEQGIFPDTKVATKGIGDSISDSIRIYATFDIQNRFIGIAAEAAAPGYQDVIRILFGYKPDCECITGINVLKMTETPGLGDKIAKDPQFLKNFTALDARLNDGKNGLRHAIQTVKHGKKTQPWQIDAISGATISSNAIGKMLNERAQQVIPLIHAHLTNFTQEFPSDAIDH
jgi:electron transport complex protein RnfG